MKKGLTVFAISTTKYC